MYNFYIFNYIHMLCDWWLLGFVAYASKFWGAYRLCARPRHKFHPRRLWAAHLSTATIGRNNRSCRKGGHLGSDTGCCALLVTLFTRSSSFFHRTPTQFWAGSSGAPVLNPNEAQQQTGQAHIDRDPPPLVHELVAELHEALETSQPGAGLSRRQRYGWSCWSDGYAGLPCRLLGQV